MAAELNPIEISTIPELAHLADEVRRTRRPRRLRHNGKDVAVLMPASTPLDAGSQSIPALEPPRSWDDVTEIATDEHAQHIVQERLPASKRRRGRPTSATDPLWAI